MRKIKETFLLCCAAAILIAVLPNLCCAQTQTVPITGKSLIIIPVFQPKKTGLPAPKPEDLQHAARLQKIPQTLIVVAPASIRFPKLTNEIAMREVAARYGSLGIQPLNAVSVPGTPGADGETILVSSGIPATVSTDEGACRVTTNPSYTYSFDMTCGQRTITYASASYYADPITLTVVSGRRFLDIDAYFTNTQTARAINGELKNVIPSTMNCIEITLSQEGVCAPVVRSMSASKENGYKFSFEDLESDGTYKVAVTDPECAPITFEISRTFAISSTTPRHTCIFNGLHCP